jgi:hypothetical protein
VGAIEELAQPDIVEVSKPYSDIAVSKNATYLLSSKNFNNLTTQLTEQNRITQYQINSIEMIFIKSTEFIVFFNVDI